MKVAEGGASMIENDASAVRFSDEDLVFLRRVRFGELPPRIRPQDWVEETETDLPTHELELSIQIVYHPGLTYVR